MSAQDARGPEDMTRPRPRLWITADSESAQWAMAPRFRASTPSKRASQCPYWESASNLGRVGGMMPSLRLRSQGSQKTRHPGWVCRGFWDFSGKMLAGQGVDPSHAVGRFGTLQQQAPHHLELDLRRLDHLVYRHALVGGVALRARAGTEVDDLDAVVGVIAAVR